MQDNRASEAPVPTGVPVVLTKPDSGFDTKSDDMLQRLGLDAELWADEFMKTNGVVTGALVPQTNDLRGWLITWFANAIENGSIYGESVGWRRSAKRHGCASDDCMLFDVHTPQPELDTTREQLSAALKAFDDMQTEVGRRQQFDSDVSLAFTHWLEFEMSRANRNNDGYMTLSRLVGQMRSAHAFGVYPWNVQGSQIDNEPKGA